MRLTILTTCLAAALCRAALGASAPVTIDHQRVGCVVSGKFPRLESRMDPADAVAHARLYFKAEAGKAWYFVEMKRAAAHAIANIIPREELSEEYIIPSVFNKAVVQAVAQAVSEAAYRTGVARRESKVLDDVQRLRR